MKTPKILYHVTHERNVASIMTSGLKASPDYILDEDDAPGVNFVADMDCLYRPDLPTDRWFSVRVADLNASDLHCFDEDSWWRYLGDVPASTVQPL